MKYTQVKSPQWANSDQTAIAAMVTFSGIGEVPFTADANDSSAHGQEIFDRCVNGEFGQVASYQPPPSSTLAALARARRNQLLQACDWTQLPDAPTETRAAWARYRQALREVTGQSKFPQEIDWPKQP